jgi:peptidoglycan/xylan/chitin deacetylase (PgdA/CDA1 family)
VSDVVDLHGLLLPHLAPFDVSARLRPGTVVTGVSGRPELLEEQAHDLPDGPAGAEALAVRLRRRGARLRWVGGEVARSRRALLALHREWGRGSVDVLRADPSLLTELAVGGWLEAGVAARAIRRVPWLAGVDGAFWSGVAAEATTEERRRLTRGYSALLYHRLAGESKPGQERLDLPPRRFDAQMQMLRRLGFSTLTTEDLLARRGGQAGARRAAVVTVDDALADIVEPLRRHAAMRPLVFVTTGAVGGQAQWFDEEAVSTWEQLASLQHAGVELGGHTRSHVDLPTTDAETARLEIAGSAEDLRDRLHVDPVAFAYPHGRWTGRERELVQRAGYSLAFTTQPGLNGAGTDPLALRRVSVKAWDTRLSFLWKVVTGEQPPRAWERWLLLRAGIGRRLARPRRSARARERETARPAEAPLPPSEP